MCVWLCPSLCLNMSLSLSMHRVFVCLFVCLSVSIKYVVSVFVTLHTSVLFLAKWLSPFVFLFWRFITWQWLFYTNLLFCLFFVVVSLYILFLLRVVPSFLYILVYGFAALSECLSLSECCLLRSASASVCRFLCVLYVSFYVCVAIGIRIQLEARR